MKRLLTYVGIFLALSGSLPTNAQPATSMQELRNLQELSAQARLNKLPIMLMFGAEWCEYCELLREEVLDPMAAGGLYEGKVVLMRHVGVDEPDPLIDWEGKPIQKSRWAYRLDADLTPTILFFDGQGKEVAPRIVGIAEITLFTNVIHRNLNIAYRNMGLDKRIPPTAELLEIQQTKQNLNRESNE
ncbi:thioredoxin family protein [Thiomicrorhabdus heinhorstiae]|uniref:Thioredoxin family protein n=1 Tax=Thiomicrorhabdus heinhorstiae TaxID=2748010 RepID=A0ABS0BYW2_9GAMM|nr:thioredoxin family protein [Thiomicrorhabdus heinhorstiae]MBF6058972.1 thioredoxin family protein [Thiomicrorhabdus heinhorstiae]